MTQPLHEQICRIGQLMYQKNYIEGRSGNISARLENEHILVTPSGLPKGFLNPNDLITVNLDGERVEPILPGTEHLHPTSELPMHLECYKQRPDVGGVVHAHPPTAVALTLANFDFNQPLIPEMIVVLGDIPVTDYATPASIENRDVIQGLIGDHDVILLAHHGSLTVASTVWDAYLCLETLEHSAKILYKVETLGGAKSHIEPTQLEKLYALRARHQLQRPYPGDKTPL